MDPSFLGEAQIMEWRHIYLRHMTFIFDEHLPFYFQYIYPLFFS